MYVGYVYFHKVRGLLSFWIGHCLLRLLYCLISTQLLFFYFLSGTYHSLLYKFKPLKVIATDEEVTSPIFIKQKWFGEQRTPVYVYKWEDVQIQHGIGDIHIDMTKAANIKRNEYDCSTSYSWQGPSDCSTKL